MKKFCLLTFLIFITSFVYCQTGSALNDGFNKIYYPNGRLQSEGNLVNGQPEGYWINYYPTGVKKSEGTRKNHKLDSIWVFYNIVGDTVSRINYLNGEKNGYYYKYYEKPELYRGNVKSKELYVGNKIGGTAYYYFPDGSINEICSYENNQKEGKSFEFAEDGRLITIYTYRKGNLKERFRINRFNSDLEKVGLWQSFYDGFRLKTEKYYKNGVIDGYYKEYDVNGQLMLTLLYRNGVLIEEVDEEKVISSERLEYYENGTVKSSGYYVKDKPVGIYKEYDITGNVTLSIIYNDKHEIVEKGIVDKEGFKTGIWEEYYSDGNLRASGEYKNNRKEGNWKFYFENGALEQDGNFSKGKYSGFWKWYYPTGEIWKEEEYYNGKEEGLYTEYDIFNNILVEGEYFDGEREGLWKTIINDYRAVGSYISGFMDGRWKHYHDNGNIAFEGYYVQGNSEGKHRYFYADGSLKEEQYYNNGIREKHWKKYNEFGDLIITISYKNNLEYRINGVKVEFTDGATTVIE
jgi:antitoxin component YwqK of YwqJK toxin-antitoxin module